MPAAPKVSGKDRKYERWRWQIFAITWLAYFGFCLTRRSFAVAKTEPNGLGLTDLQMSWVDGASLTTFAIGHFVWGICGDRYGTRKVILIGMLAVALITVAMGAASLFTPLLIFSALQGLCLSTGWAPLSKNLSNFFSQRERGTVMGLWCTNYAVGGVTASYVAGYFGERFGWRYAFWVPAVMVAAIWLLFMLLQRNRPEDVGLPPIEVYHGEREAVIQAAEKPEEETEGSWKVIAKVLKNPMVQLFSAVYFFMKPTRFALLLWAPKYLSEQLHTGMARSATLGALFEMAGPVSVLLAGVASDRFFGSRRNPISVVCLMAAGTLLFFFDKLPHTELMLGGGLLMIGFLMFAPDSLVSGTAGVDFGTKKGASTATGLINGWGSIGAIVGGTLPGIFHSRWGWDGVFTCCSVSLVISGLLLLPKWNALPATAKLAPQPSAAPEATQVTRG